MAAAGFNGSHPEMAVTMPENPVGQGLVALVVTLTSISIITTVVRVVIRSLTRVVGWEDAAVVVGLAFIIVHTTCEIIAGENGLGLHIQQVPLKYMSTILKWSLISQLFLMLSLCFTKCSICLFVLRIQNTGWLKWTLWGLIAAFVVTELPVFIFWFLNCTPIDSFWTGHLEKCHGATIYNDLVWLQIACAIVGDIACSTLPIVMLYKIQMKQSLKYAVCALMMLGLVATGCSIGRAVTTAHLDLTDLTYSIAPIQFWCSAEANCAIIGANLALSRMVFMYFKHGGRNQTTRAYEEIERKESSAESGSRGRKLLRTDVREARELAQLEHGVEYHSR